MQVLQISATDIGGAGRAADRLNQGLQAIGIHSEMLVQNKMGDDKTVFPPSTQLGKNFAKLRPTLNRLPLKFYSHREPTDYSVAWLPDTVAQQVQTFSPDLVNLHWVSDGHLNMKTISTLKMPIIWTLHDMWAFTGGCHYSYDCDRYTQSCFTCPQLSSKRKYDLSQWHWRQKINWFKAANITLVSPSRWLAECAGASSIFRDRCINVIPNGIDIQKYKPVESKVARELLNLPQDKYLILFGAANATLDKRKGFSLLEKALQGIGCSDLQDKIELVIFGSSNPNAQPALNSKIHYLGKLKDDISLALAYAAVDVFVAPSIEDNLPNTVMESIACGTPCVAFNIGGLPDLIDHRLNGYLAQPYSTTDLAKGIIWVIENEERSQKLRYQARNKAKTEFSLSIQANRYQDLYSKVLLDKM
jgi:glycosyltransferase involved in cell wall biosynthesis